VLHRPCSGKRKAGEALNTENRLPGRPAAGPGSAVVYPPQDGHRKANRLPCSYDFAMRPPQRGRRIGASRAQP
jgi:hypothetical protein